MALSELSLARFNAFTWLMRFELIDKKKLRREYSFGSLDQSELEVTPYLQFVKWFKEAEAEELVDVSAMSLATCGAKGKPSVRIVLLKHFDESGFCWYSDYESSKGKQLSENDYCEILFYWREFDRQIRISGKVTRLGSDESDLYFNQRPLESQAAAVASRQSQPVETRAILEERFQAEIARSEKARLERPERWGGYRLIPEQYEFWQGREGRLHDRFRFASHNGQWKSERLQP